MPPKDRRDQWKSIKRLHNRVKNFTARSDIPVILMTFRKGRGKNCVQGSTTLTGNLGALSEVVKESFIDALQQVDVNQDDEQVKNDSENEDYLREDVEEGVIPLLKRLPNVPVPLLRAVITRALRPPGVMPSKLYEQIQPPWWPDEVPYASVNHSKPGQGRHNRAQLLLIAQSLAKFYNVWSDSDENTHVEYEEGQAMDEGQDEMEDEQGEEVEEESGPEKVLQRLSSKKDWQYFLRAARECINTTSLSNMGHHFVNTVDSKVDGRFLRRRYYLEGRRVYPVNCTGNGNSLFNAVSLSFFGNEMYSIPLRLAAVKAGVTKFAEITAMLLEEFKTLENALSYASEVLRDEDDFPRIGTPQTVLESTLRSGIMATAKNLSDSGLLQVTLLAFALECKIKVFVDNDHEWTARCGEDGNNSACVLWCKATEESPQLSHFEPLLPMNDHSAENQVIGQDKAPFNFRINNKCSAVMWGMCQEKEKDLQEAVSLVQCAKCTKWYHSCCLGLPLPVVVNINFSCCSPIAGEDNKQLVMLPKVGSLISAEIKLSDVLSLQSNAGITNGVVDFYIRYLQERCDPNIMLFSTVASHIACFKGGIASSVLRHAKEYTRPIDQKVFVFPVCLGSQRHWIMIAFVSCKDRRFYFAMDPLKPLEKHPRTVSYLWRYLTILLGPNLPKDIPEFCTIEMPLQRGSDYCMKMLQNMEIFSSLSVEEMTGDVSLKSIATKSGRGMRCSIVKIILQTLVGTKKSNLGLEMESTH